MIAPREISPEERHAPSRWACDVQRATAAAATISHGREEEERGQPSQQDVGGSDKQAEELAKSRTASQSRRKGTSLWSQGQSEIPPPIAPQQLFLHNIEEARRGRDLTDGRTEGEGERPSEAVNADGVSGPGQDSPRKAKSSEQATSEKPSLEVTDRQQQQQQEEKEVEQEKLEKQDSQENKPTPQKKLRIRTGSLEVPSIPTRVGTIFQKCHLEEQAGRELPKGAVTSLKAAVFEDTRWKNALDHLASSGEWRNQEDLEGLIRAGAKTFGFWHLPSPIVKALAAHLDKSLQQPTRSTCPLAPQGSATQEGEACLQPSAALAERLEEVKSTIAAQASDSTAASSRAATASTSPNLAFKSEYPAQQQGGRFSSCFAKVKKQEAWGTKVTLTVMVLILSNIYAMEVCCIMYPGLISLFGVPIWIARAGGMGTLLWTALLFLTMSRTVIKIVARLLPLQSVFYEVLDQHKELHIFCGRMCFLTGAIHTIAHCIGTVPGIISHTLAEVNAILGCANPDSTPGYMAGGTFAALQITQCPLQERPTYLGAVVATTPGLSGVALVLLAAALFYTASAKARQLKFERFIYLHYVAIPAWLVVLFLHGSAGWVGVGFPLVTFVCSLPFVLYLLDHILRSLRYYLLRGSLLVEDVVIRPGLRGRTEGSLINLKLRKPSLLWSYREGMYAFLCMPHYSKWQWHPFTICSGADDATVDFIVHACGDWTKELAEICLQAHSRQGLLMQLAMDGPYLAPTATALTHEVLVAVGAGVGITPFLSLMSTIVSVVGKESSKALPLKEAHFFWMTRSADELLFGRRQFTRIVTDPVLRSKVFLHLHVTQKDSHEDAASYLFREIVRRQSVIDRSAFLEAWKSSPEFAAAGRGLQFPSCWSVGVDQDVLWTSSLVESIGEEEARLDGELAEAYADHWASGIRSLRADSATSADSRKSQARGLFAPTRSASMNGESSMDSTALTPRESISIPIERGPYSLPVIFGRPNFQRELRAIGKANPNQNVHVYACGNDALVQSLKSCCSQCSLSAKASKEELNMQDFVLHFERFG